MCHFKEIDFGLKNQKMGGTEPPFRANLLFGMLKVVLSEPSFRDRPNVNENERVDEHVNEKVHVNGHGHANGNKHEHGNNAT